MLPIAKILSWVLHPILMPVIAVALAMYVDPPLVYFVPPPARSIMLAMLAVMTIAFPLTSTLLLIKAGVVRDVHMHIRQERIAPYLLTLIHFGLAYYLFRQAPVHPALLAVLFGSILATALTFVITFFWKISAHMVGAGGVIGMLSGISFIHHIPLLDLTAVAIVLAGALGTARLLTSDHTQGQVILGALVGWACVHTTTLFHWYI